MEDHDEPFGGQASDQQRYKEEEQQFIRELMARKDVPVEKVRTRSPKKWLILIILILLIGAIAGAVVLATQKKKGDNKAKTEYNAQVASSALDDYLTYLIFGENEDNQELDFISFLKDDYSVIHPGGSVVFERKIAEDSEDKPAIIEALDKKYIAFRDEYKKKDGIEYGENTAARNYYYYASFYHEISLEYVFEIYKEDGINGTKYMLEQEFSTDSDDEETKSLFQAAQSFYLKYAEIFDEANNQGCIVDGEMDKACIYKLTNTESSKLGQLHMDIDNIKLSLREKAMRELEEAYLDLHPEIENQEELVDAKK